MTDLKSVSFADIPRSSFTEYEVGSKVSSDRAVLCKGHMFFLVEHDDSDFEEIGLADESGFDVLEYQKPLRHFSRKPKK